VKNHEWLGGQRWLTGAIPAKLGAAVNESVLRYLEEHRPSAHSDLVQEMFSATAGFEHIEAYCPDPKTYKFVVLFTCSGVIFALARGMRRLAFRLSREDAEEAVTDGASAEREIGPGWISVDAFDPAKPRAMHRLSLKAWARAAHRFAESRVTKA
jgi:hypothetical protein